MSVQQRIRRLEAIVRMQWIVALGLIALGCLTAARQSPGVVEATRIDVLDERGAVRALIGSVEPGAYGLYLRDEQGDLRASLDIRGVGPSGLTIAPPGELADDTPSIMLLVNDQQASVTAGSQRLSSTLIAGREVAIVSAVQDQDVLGFQMDRNGLAIGYRLRMALRNE